MDIYTKSLQEKGAEAKNKLVPFLLFIFSLSVNAFYFLKIMKHNFIFGKYPELALNLVRESWLGSNVFGDNPFYIYFHAVLLKIFDSYSLTAAITIQFITGSLSCLLTYFIAKRLFGQKTAVIASFIQAIYANLIIYQGSLLPETFIIFFNSLAILYLLKFFEVRRLSSLFLAGIFLGISANARGKGLGFFILCA